jgi:hypothetical protein
MFAKRPEILTKLGHLQSVPWWKIHTALDDLPMKKPPAACWKIHGFSDPSKQKKTSIDTVCSHSFP